MTISNTSRTAGPFTGTGANTSFPFTFKVFARSDLLVARTVTATAVESTLVLDVDYVVSLSTNQNATPGGVITLANPLAIGTTLAATSNLPIQQSLELTNQGGFYPTVINDALDRIVITIQQLAAKIGNGALNVGAAAQIAAILSTLANLAGASGSNLVGWFQAGVNAVVRTVRDKLRETMTPEDFGAGAGVSDTVAFQRLAAACQLLSRNIELPRVYNIDQDVSLPSGISVSGKGRLNTGLQFSGTAALSIVGDTGTKNGGNMAFSRMLISHSTSGVVLKLSEFKYITFFDVELYHGSINLYKFSYLTFLKCIGFDLVITAANSVNTLNESLKVLGCNFSNIPLVITETTDVVVSDTHMLGAASQISVARGQMPPGFYPLVTITTTVVDSTANEAVTLTGCTPRISGSFLSGGRTNGKPGLYMYNCAEGSVTGNTMRYCGSHGIQSDTCFGIDVSGNSLTDNQQNGTQMVSCDQMSYRGNLLGNTPGWYGGSFTQQYGIVDSAGNCTNTIVDGNKFVGNAVAAVYLPNASTQYGINTGLLRTNYGTANITTSAGAAVIPHGLGAVPKYASADAVSGADMRTQITNIDSVNITIRLSTSTTNANINNAFAVLWEAKL